MPIVTSSLTPVSAVRRRRRRGPVGKSAVSTFSFFLVAQQQQLKQQQHQLPASGIYLHKHTFGGRGGPEHISSSSNRFTAPAWLVDVSAASSEPFFPVSTSTGCCCFLWCRPHFIALAWSFLTFVRPPLCLSGGVLPVVEVTLSNDTEAAAAASLAGGRCENVSENYNELPLLLTDLLLARHAPSAQTDSPVRSTYTHLLELYPLSICALIHLGSFSPYPQESIAA